MKRKKIHTHFGIHRDAGHRNDSVGGGDWTTRKNYQHFELIESPAEVKFPFALSDE